MLPTIKIGDSDITRLIVGSNPFTGKSHLTPEADADMKNHYSELDNIFATLRRCEEAGINTFQSRGSMPLMDIIDRYNKNGGRMNYIATSAKNLTTFEEELDEMMKYHPTAIAIHGELADALYMADKLDEIPALLDMIRKRGVPAGLCAHFPQVLAYAEKQSFRPDFYMASLYNLSQPDRSHDKNPTGERFEESDIPIMYETIRSLSAPTIALKILGAGRRCTTQEQVKDVFTEAFASIKPCDAVLVGMFDAHIDQVSLDASYAAEAIAKASI